MIGLGSTGDTVLVKSREMPGRTQTLPWWLGEKGQRRQKTKYTLAPLHRSIFLYPLRLLFKSVLKDTKPAGVIFSALLKKLKCGRKESGKKSLAWNGFLQKVWNDVYRTRLSRRRMIRLFATPLPLPSLSFSVFLCVAGSF
jgi:hypothetical protein